MTDFVPYRVTQGIPWERLIVVRDRRTHRIVRPENAWARVKLNESTSTIIDVEITSEGALMLTLTADETKSLPVGDLEFDVVGRTYKRQSLVYGSLTTYPGRLTGELITQPLARGVLKVSALNTITSLNEEEVRMQQVLNIVFKKGADVRRYYTWQENGTVLQVQNARMQARNNNGDLVLDLKWFSEVPSESTVIALPGIERGYLAPAEEATLELHISDTNSITPGTYHYDIFVQRINEDWTYWMGGDLVVEEAVTLRT
jgi:hypothetical protein